MTKWLANKPESSSLRVNTKLPIGLSSDRNPSYISSVQFRIGATKNNFTTFFCFGVSVKKK